MLHVALWEPEIPPNTGNVARLCAATNTRLHLIGRLGFRLDDRSLRRAGVDYWAAVDVVRHVTFADFEHALGLGSGGTLPPGPLPSGRGSSEEARSPSGSGRDSATSSLSLPSGRGPGDGLLSLPPPFLGEGAGGRGSLPPPARIWCIETPSSRPYTRAEFAEGDCLLFGSESSGLPLSVRERYADRLVGIPMPNGAVRSLNLATSVGIVLYDALRRLRGW
ncbi:MAG TPA: tRNA (cytidine(34)-2'-O)-methyltransferase [Gemmata sp.]